jgi:protocatechuate 3,4-dioxygenase alpha subunit
MAKFGQTPSQTVGPYFAYGLTPGQYAYQFRALADAHVITPDADGERIRIEGRVLDGNAAPIEDALVEIWQADGNGRYPHPADVKRADSSFKGFGRCGTGTDPHRRFIFHTIKPASPDEVQAPHINVIVLMRGMLVHAFTRFYFSDETRANMRDPVLNSVPADRRHTLIATRSDSNDGVIYFRDIYMQGDQETVFFDA